MFNIYSKKLITSAYVLLLTLPLQVGAEITSSADSKQAFYQVPINKSLLINFDKNYTKITKGNDSIADITLLSPGKILLRGIQIGGTNATIWDNDNKVALVLDVQVTHNLNGLKQKLFELMPNEAIKVNAAEKCIVLSGEVSSLVNLDFAVKIAQGYAAAGMTSGGGSGGGSIGGGSSGGSIGGGSSGGSMGGGSSGGGGSGGGGGGGGAGGSSGGCMNSTGASSSGTSNYIINMMHVGGEQQVMLEVKVAEVSTVIARGLSLSQGASSNLNASTNSYLSTTTTTQGQSVPFLFNVAAAGAGMFTGSFASGSSLLNLSLNISKNSNLATILAEPNLSTLSGKKAEFLSGGEFPYVSNCASGGGSACTTSFKSYGVALEFTPIVLDGNRINLSTHISVSFLTNTANQVLQIGAPTSLTGSSSAPQSSSPSLDLREAQTTIELSDGQTMSIAGLINQKEINSQQTTPGLADIPWLGALFKNRSSETDKRELVILITPHLVKPLPSNQIKLPTDNYVQPNDIDFYLLGKIDAKKPQTQSVQVNTYDPTLGGTTGQFGHQINAGGSK